MNKHILLMEEVYSDLGQYILNCDLFCGTNSIFKTSLRTDDQVIK
uniref:Uncharacterized protein n=1 Tax=Bartonella rochalimae ATCC BAA-1498 TaxID=685782 RepID=E6YL44_9HYPH|nr:hypothetical protein BARRO_30163 [Bartonella rochalimae ATCC BAA-1498]